MNTCPECSSACGDAGCGNCGYRPETIDGFVAYAPTLARCSPGFDPEHFKFLAQLESGNFWFKARNELILWAIRRQKVKLDDYLEIGCGTGFVLSAIAGANPHARVSGSEIFVDGLAIAAQRVPAARFFQMDAQSIPFTASFDAIGAYDVVEHIEADERVLAQIHQALRPAGKVMLTVPQHRWLWSKQDDVAHHVRRYAPGELERKLAAAGFRVDFSSSFVALLMPAMMLSRLSIGRKASEDDDVFAEFRIPGWLNRCLLAAMRVERWLIGAGLRFPFGGSRLVVATKA
jgi:SAM-dependent methyltransferase